MARRGDCKHFNGLQHRSCVAGVDYATVRPPRPGHLQLPCLDDGSCKVVPCAKREYKTPEEMAAELKEFVQQSTRAVQALTAIHEAVGKRRGVNGTLPCPACKTGTLNYGVAAGNGHVAAVCSTPKCVRFIQ